MYKLAASYGKKTWDVWEANRLPNLRGTQTGGEQANANVWRVSSFHQLIERVAFLGAMNKRLTLFYRGQREDIDPLPMLFREGWICFDSEELFGITAATRGAYWDELLRIGRRVYAISEDLGLPRRRGLRDIREVQWAVVQHYGLWPTPLLDLTSSLRTAASFAMAFERAKPGASRTGFVYVVGMPHSVGSISYDIDQQLVLARLQSACPPVAKRPHYQEGFLVGRFPMHDAATERRDKSRLVRRLIAKFELRDAGGSFWDDNFPPVPREALLPPANRDPLHQRFVTEFGNEAKGSVRLRAEKLSEGQNQTAQD